MDEPLLDHVSLMHWLNARKLTPQALSERTGLSKERIEGLLRQGGRVGPTEVHCLTGALDLEWAQLEAPPALPEVLYQPRAELEKSRRPLRRDGIHFYNYYSLPAPRGKVAPVILDILCPPDRLPKLNEGHLEPAITVNLGPGPINGRWGEELKESTWRVLEANPQGPAPWIVGDTYLEPPYCPHSYSRASELPARIVSYTAKSNLADFVRKSNRWSGRAFAALIGGFSGRSRCGAILRMHMDRRGYTSDVLAPRLSIDLRRLQDHLEGNQVLDPAELRRVGALLGVDCRLLLPPQGPWDEVGKTFLSVAESRTGMRSFRSYMMASTAGASHLSDLVGLFIFVEGEGSGHVLDLLDYGSTHFLVTSGRLRLHWQTADGSVKSQSLERDDSLWLSPYVPHGFTGSGSVLKLGSGDGMSYLDQLELTNTFGVEATLRRARRDQQGWGYDG